MSENKEITIEDVIEFIDKNYSVYGARIEKELSDRKKDFTGDLKKISNKRDSMYKRLANL